MKIHNDLVTVLSCSMVDAAFAKTEEVELQLAPNNNASTVATGSSQNAGDAGSTQTNGGAPRQSPLRTPSLSHDTQEHVELEQLQVEDWEDALLEDKATEEVELARVQQEIERLRQEQEAIIRRQATT
jgi:hypothetical protein